MKDFLTVEQWLEQISKKGYYGSFARRMVSAYIYADRKNQIRIEAGFPCLAIAFRQWYEQ